MACNDKSVTTSLTVSFSVDGTTGDGSIVAEIDSREDGLNAGDTSFSPGDRVGFLVWPGTGVTVTGVTTSLGSVTGANGGTTEEIETLQFILPDSVEHTLNKKPLSITSFEWVGNPPPSGTLQITGQSVKLNLPTDQCFSPSGHILKVKYTSRYEGYYLYHTAPTLEDDETSYEILVLVVGTLN